MSESITRDAVEPRTRSGDDATNVYRELRRRILNGDLEPGVRVAQSKLAELVGVGRTPLREALRMLQQEGLVLAVRNKGIRISPIDLEELDCIYGFRVAMEATAARISVPLMSVRDFEELAETMAQMKPAIEQGDRDAYEQPHRRFHELLMNHVQPTAQRRIELDSERAERYRRLFMQGDRTALATADDEHREIIEACEARDGERAAALVAHHLARSAFHVAVQLDPTFNPVMTRTALTMVLGPDRAASTERRAGLAQGHDRPTTREKTS